MTIKLRQSTASQEIPLGFFVDSTDGNSEEIALSIANTDIWLWKMGATAIANKNSGGATHMQNGLYYCVLDATDTNTLGALVVFVHKSGALAVRVECEVLDAVVYDSLIAASDKLQVDTVQVGGTTQTAGDIMADTNDIQSRLPAALVSGRMDSSVGAYQSGMTPLQPTVAGRTLDVTATGEAGLDLDNTAGTLAKGTELTGFNDLDAAGIRSATGLASANLDTQLAALPTATENADQVWDEAIAGHLGAGSTGEKLDSAGSAGDPWGTAVPGAYGAGTAGKILGDNLNAAISSRSSHSAADVWASGTRTLTDISATIANKLADHTLRRTYANARASSDGDTFDFRSLLGAIAKLVNKWTISGATLTLYHEDDATSAGTQAITSDAAADPITQLDTN
jgi:hypothetical protein